MGGCENDSGVTGLRCEGKTRGAILKSVQKTSGAITWQSGYVSSFSRLGSDDSKTELGKCLHLITRILTPDQRAGFGTFYQEGVSMKGPTGMTVVQTP